MSVELDPPELGFQRPFTHEVSQTLRLRNPNSDPVAFKVKTTAPKQYCVRPNSGRIEANGDVQVQVLLQAMKEDPPPEAKCRDKFLVQSVAISPSTDTSANVSQIWANIEQTAKSSIVERKIRVSFLPAGGSATTNGVSSTSQHEDEQPPAYSSPTAVTPSRPTDARDTSAVDSTMGSTIIGGAAGAATGAASSIASAVPTSQDELKQQLSNANATIARLREQAAEGIRQRKPQEAAQKAVDSVQQSLQNAPAPGGVPIQIVAGLCLLCFLIAYLFF